MGRDVARSLEAREDPESGAATGDGRVRAGFKSGLGLIRGSRLGRMNNAGSRGEGWYGATDFDRVDRAVGFVDTLALAVGHHDPELVRDAAVRGGRDRAVAAPARHGAAELGPAALAQTRPRPWRRPWRGSWHRSGPPEPGCGAGRHGLRRPVRVRLRSTLAQPRRRARGSDLVCGSALCPTGDARVRRRGCAFTRRRGCAPTHRRAASRPEPRAPATLVRPQPRARAPGLRPQCRPRSDWV